MKKFNLAAPVFISLLATNVFAGGASPIYLGATYGKSTVDNAPNQMDNHGFCQGASSQGEECRIGDGDDNVAHIYGGFQLSDNIAIEAGYVNLGNTAAYHYTDPVTITQQTEGFTAAGVYRHRLGKTSPVLAYGKAGIIRWSSEANSTQDYPGTADDSGISPMLGVGVEYEMTHNISLKAGWDRYYDVGEGDAMLNIDQHNKGSYGIDTLETDVDVYSAGINFSFL